jgi:eukaryotic-like serine/threonine-protein kinase
VTTTASTTLVAALLLGAFAWSIFDRTRRADAAGQATLTKVEFLEADARKTDDPIRWKEAIAEARRAEAQFESGGGSDAAKSRASAKLTELQGALGVVERDRKMIDDLDQARLRATANDKNSHFDTRAKREAYLTAFRTYGIDVTTLPVDEASRQIRSSKLVEELISALDDWASYDSADVPKTRLAAIARAAESDPARVVISDFIARHDASALRLLCEREEGRRHLGPRLRSVFDALLRFDPNGSLPLLETIRRESPSDFWLNHDLGRAYQISTPPRFLEALSCLSVAVSLRPNSPGAHLNLGVTLRAKGDLDGAIAEYRIALRLDPRDSQVHTNLGNALDDKGDLDGAIAEYRTAIRLDPDFAAAHSNLGIALKTKGDLDGAIAEYGITIRLDPEDALAYCNLGLVQQRLGLFADALLHLERGHELGSKQANWKHNSSRWVSDCRRLVDLEPRLVAILKGSESPKDSVERVALANFCYQKALYVASSRFYDQAFSDEPHMAEDLDSGRRYDAACAAALAGSGVAKDDPSPDDLARTKLREQALRWLRADLAARTKVLDGGDAKAG